MLHGKYFYMNVDYNETEDTETINLENTIENSYDTSQESNQTKKPKKKGRKKKNIGNNSSIKLKLNLCHN